MASICVVIFKRARKLLHNRGNLLIPSHDERASSTVNEQYLTHEREMDLMWLGIGECVPSDKDQNMDCCLSSRWNEKGTVRGVPWAEVKGAASMPPKASRRRDREELYMGPRRARTAHDVRSTTPSSAHNEELYMGPQGARRGFGVVPMFPSQISKAGEQQPQSPRHLARPGPGPQEF